jgi:hypothetical protein
MIAIGRQTGGIARAIFSKMEENFCPECSIPLSLTMLSLLNKQVIPAQESPLSGEDDHAQ